MALTPVINLEVRTGADLTDVITWRDTTGALVNLTGYTAEADFKDRAGAVVLTASTGNSRLALGGAGGTITFNVAGVVTAALAAGTYSYDILATSGASAKTVVCRGSLTVEPMVTS